MHNEILVETEQQVNMLHEVSTILEFEVAPTFANAEESAFIINLSAQVKQSATVMSDLFLALWGALEIAIRQRDEATRQAITFYRQQLNMRIQSKFGLDNEAATLVLDWITGEADLPIGVYDSNAVSAVLWVVKDTTEALEGLVYDDNFDEYGYLEDAS